tara:strand:- start:612 stop:1187 length:576 start_codon:yes stop_codon:yes gene_type:complete
MKSLKPSRFGKLGVLFSVIILAGCENARESMGLAKQSPDEFAVVTRAPLSMPPEYGLRPPRPGVLRPQEAKVEDSARNELIRSTGTKPVSSRNSGRSPGETALLAKAGATNPDPSIRGAINRESSILATEDDSFADRLIFWQGKQPPGAIVDAAAEQKRLRENAGLGDAPTRGRTPKIVRKPKGWLEGIFN